MITTLVYVSWYIIAQSWCALLYRVGGRCYMAQGAGEMEAVKLRMCSQFRIRIIYF
jgi:hypothetical protein